MPYAPSQIIQQGNIGNMKIGNGEANDVVIQLAGAKGALLVGGAQIAALDLSKGVAAGRVSIGTGFFATKSSREP